MTGLPGCHQDHAKATSNTSTAPQTPVQTSRSAYQPRPIQRESQEELAAAIRDADLSVLFIGNSHSAPMPDLLDKLASQLSPERNCLFRRVPKFGFLVDHAGYQPTLDLIDAGPWDYVVLQAQKYSTTGRFHYPIDGALALSERAAARGARVIMFPEWSQRGSPDEYLRITRLHEEIAEQTGAIVAPIGEAWHRAQEQFPQINLYYVDGNHANDQGNWLTACVLYAVLTGEHPHAEAARAGDAKSVESRLADLAWETVSSTEEDQCP